MEVYTSQDGQVSKYVHDDGSETAVKTVSSCGNIVNKITGQVEAVEVDRRKYSTFISSSVGCPLGCKFCYLTVKKFPYVKLTPQQVIDNVKDALLAEVGRKPDIRNKYIKLSWMGMGDAFLWDPYDVRQATEYLVSWIIGDQNLACGLDGVDISTIMPEGCYGWPHQFAVLNNYLRERYRRNPSSLDRSVVRLFYSLHGVSQRKALIPSSRENAPETDVRELFKVKQWYGIDVILHHMLLKGVNDGSADINDVEFIIKHLTKDVELRFLRYNQCPGSPYEESKKFDELVKSYAKVLPKVKYQISAGSEIKAACGQFLCLTNKDG